MVRESGENYHSDMGEYVAEIWMGDYLKKRSRKHLLCQMSQFMREFEIGVRQFVLIS
jgi:hypothetical protein